MASQRLSQWLALRCKEEAFQRFLGAVDEAEAAAVVRIVCGVASRGQLDRDPAAAALLHEIIRKPFIEFVNQQDEK